MKVEIIADSDGSFTFNPEPLVNDIECKPFGNVWVACDGLRTSIGKTEQEAIDGVLELIMFEKYPTPIQEEQVIEEIPQPPASDIQRGARIDNYTEPNSFDFFSGTSWAGKKQNFD